MHTQQGEGKRDWRQFSKNNTDQVSACAPSLTPRRHRRVKTAPRTERGRAVPTRKEEGSRDSRTPGRPGAAPPGSPSLSTGQVQRGASPSEPRAKVARGHPKSEDAARPAQPGTGTGGGAPGIERKAGRSRRALAVAKRPGFPLRRWLPGVCAGRGWRPVSPRHCPFRSTQAFDSRPRSAPFQPRVRGGIAEKEETSEGEQALASRATRSALGARLQLGGGDSPDAGGRARGAALHRAGLACTPTGARHRAQPPPATRKLRALARGPRALGLLSPVPPLVLPPKPLTRVFLPTFLNLFCQLFAPGRNKALLSGVCRNAVPRRRLTFSPSPRTPSEGVRGHLPLSRT